MDINTCNYIGCSNTSQNSVMFPYPVDDWKRLNLWLLHSGKSLEFRDKYICFKHFHPSKLRKDSFGVTGLREGAVPRDYLQRGLEDWNDEQETPVLTRPAKVYQKSYTKKGNLIQRDAKFNTGINLNMHLTQAIQEENEREQVSVYTIAANGVLTDSKNSKISNKNTDRQTFVNPENSTEIQVKKEPEDTVEFNIHENDNPEESGKTTLKASTDFQIKTEPPEVVDIKLEKDSEPNMLEVEIEMPFTSEPSPEVSKYNPETNERLHFEEVVIKVEQSTVDVEITSDVLNRETNVKSDVVVDIKSEWNECSDPEVECGDPGVECNSESIECDSAVVGCTSDALNTEAQAVELTNDADKSETPGAPKFYDAASEPWCCGACPSKYHYKYDLQSAAPKYPKSIFQEAPDEPLRCAICNAQFQQRCDFQKHMEENHRPAVKPFQCDLCYVRFKYEFMLTTHKKEHRDRGILFSQEETNTLQALVEKYKHILNSKRKGRINWSQRAQIWEKMQKQFNATARTPRTINQLKCRLETMKRSAKKEATAE